ncbi:transporting ATPase [Halioglobus maricola]|uniref:Transporting ATPase n=1 Tax=Halioglobus maricola TaxID=2601894 RepID=A0A5P9NJI6_9GAMM|nr:elongation factor P hydroxylase [Halioglobus maricola]QFU76043.1 transporting ATPase [Halioglobus maricola]
MGVAVATCVFDSRRLEAVFDRCFEVSENTLLVGGADEPLYRPAGTSQPHHLLYYREDFFASALHEISHWCIAGPERRQQVDFGYWYAPEGRSESEQHAFEAVEVKPQAVEWCLSRACGYRFRVSVDNFGDGGVLPDTTGFRAAVLAQVKQWQRDGLPVRAQQFYTALCAEFGTSTTLKSQHFSAEDLD